MVLLAAAVVYNEVLLGFLDPAPPLAPDTLRAIRITQLVWGAAGAMAIGGALLMRRIPALARATSGEVGARVLLVGLSILLPLGLLEGGMRPWFVPTRTTTLFERDDALGWSHRRGVSAEWEGARVRINAKGLRGPELPYAKPPGVFRILWLGDSVTFGDKIGEDGEIFPFLAEQFLESEGALEVETINAGVSGYSPWQELRYLRDEGLRYDPDLIVVGFVPNDVTELLELERFGGSWEGWQLWYSRSPLRHALDQSAVFNALSRGIAGLRFGREVSAGARRKEVINVRALVDEPDRPDVAAAWRKALDDVGAMHAVAQENGRRLLLAALPFAFQLERAQPSDPPQERLRAFAEARGIPYLDLLPILRQDAGRRGAPASEYFIDHVHLTPGGMRVVAAAIARFVTEAGLVTGGPEGSGRVRGS